MLVESPGHSSQVKILLRVGATFLSVSQVGEDSLILREPCKLHDDRGVVIVRIDGIEKEFPIVIQVMETERIVRFSEDRTANRSQQWLFDNEDEHPECPF
jgi:hypothetical protein